MSRKFSQFHSIDFVRNKLSGEPLPPDEQLAQIAELPANLELAILEAAEKRRRMRDWKTITGKKKKKFQGGISTRKIRADRESDVSSESGSGSESEDIAQSENEVKEEEEDGE
eukprot:gene43612-54179_t